ncbi:MAG: hypothetical protein KUG77_04830, partial [Nannocystaceae bacterium]|nr:hypothetical protein [Nannocystaceae bacterium]
MDTVGRKVHHAPSACTLAAGALSCLLAGPASAANAVHPRTPVEWPVSECLQTVDRSVDPRFEFSYAIPYEDLNVTADELEDSRRHQFVAFCQHWDREAGLPNYVSAADRDRAVEAGLEQPSSRGDDVLEGSAQWPETCWVLSL